MKKSIVFTQSGPNNETLEKRIFEISEQEISNYRFLCPVTGIGIEHCFWVGLRHHPNFWERVHCYHLTKTKEKMAEIFNKETGQTYEYFDVNFYEEKDSKDNQEASEKNIAGQ